MSQIIVDQFGEPISLWQTLMGRNCEFYLITDFRLGDPSPIGAVLEGGDLVQDEAFYSVAFFNCSLADRADYDC